jgi:hypothetical protein
MLIGKLEVKKLHERPNGKIMLKWSFKNGGVRVRTGFNWLRIGSSDEPSSCIKGE